MKLRLRLLVLGVSFGILLTAICISGPAFAQSASTNYKVEESFFGIGGELDASSSNYSAKQSSGETAVGNSSSSSYQMQAGFNTTDQPLLEVAVNGGTYDMGILDYGSTGAVSASFTVRNYLSNGYIVVLSGDTPTLADNTYSLPAMSDAATSQPGTEQFGVNLVDNASPDIGADPAQVPDSTFSFGTPVAGYDTADYFKFVNGGTIAMSAKAVARLTMLFL